MFRAYWKGRSSQAFLRTRLAPRIAVLPCEWPLSPFLGIVRLRCPAPKQCTDHCGSPPDPNRSVFHPRSHKSLNIPTVMAYFESPWLAAWVRCFEATLSSLHSLSPSCPSCHALSLVVVGGSSQGQVRGCTRYGFEPGPGTGLGQAPAAVSQSRVPTSVCASACRRDSWLPNFKKSASLNSLKFLAAPSHSSTYINSPATFIQVKLSTFLARILIALIDIYE